MIDELRSRFAQNLERAQGLIDIYAERSGANRGRATTADADLLRAAVVFMHAAVEDLLRTAAEWRLPLSDAQVLKDLKIPLGDEPRDHKDKVTLRDLAARYRDQTIDSLVRASVEAHLEQKSYNNLHELWQAMQQLGINANGWPEADKRELLAMMARRHQIAHRVDRNPMSGSGHHQAVSLSRSTVESWMTAAQKFGRFFISHLEQTAGGRA